MVPYTFKCRALNMEHSCRHKNETYPRHPPKLLKCIEDVIEATEAMSFKGIIKSSKNNYQIDFDFDKCWIQAMNIVGWESQSAKKLTSLRDIPNIKPDGILENNNVIVTVEIEKSNKKTIWFDFMKLTLLIGRQIADYGILVVPRNYAHKNGIWDLFFEARYYRYCLAKFAKVDEELLSKIAIIGYTQESYGVKKWQQMDASIINSIKEQAKAEK